jgi:hypothetical protein
MTLVLCTTVVAQRPPSRGPQFQRSSPPQEQKPAVQKMRVEDGKVHADITDSPLQNVLQELADRTGIIFEVRSQENPLVSVHLDWVSVQEAIQRIASGSNTIFFYGQDKSGPERITLVSVFPRTNAVQQPGIVYLGTGGVTKSNEDIQTPEQALRILSGNADVEARERAIEILVSTKSDAAIKALRNSISDPAPEIRVAAIEGLATLGARQALPGILKSLKDPHPGVRQSAITAVALLGDARNLKDLKPLSTDKDNSVATAAEIAIRQLSAAIKK